MSTIVMGSDSIINLENPINIPAGSFDDRRTVISGGGVTSEPIIEGNPEAPEDGYKPENRPVNGNNNTELKNLHRASTQAKTELSEAKKALREKEEAMREAKRAREDAKQAVKAAKKAMKSANSLEVAAFAWKRAIVAQKQANLAYKNAVSSYNEAVTIFNGKLANCVSITEKYNKFRMKTMNAPKDFKKDIARTNKSYIENLKNSKPNKLTKFSETKKMLKKICSEHPSRICYGGSGTLIAALGIAIFAAYASNNQSNAEAETPVNSTNENEKSTTPATGKENTENITEENTTETGETEETTVEDAASNESTEEIASVEEQEAEAIDETTVDEEIVADETESIYEVQKGDNLWNICKKELQDKNGEAPTAAQIVARIGEVMEQNGLKWESDGKNVIIYPDQKLKM